jgi:nucleotide-binding universal stress UspA family protein
VIGHLLVPHDLTDLSDAPFAAIRALGTAFGTLHVVHALPRVDPTLPGGVWPKEEDAAREVHARQTLRARASAAGFDQAVIHVAHGDPASRIVALASEIGAGLIVMPSHCRKGLQRVVLGSVAEHVVRFSPCPVLVLPAGAVPAGSRHPPSAPPVPDQTPEEQVETLACAILDAVAARKGLLTAARLLVPGSRPVEWWEAALERRLGDSGVEFVDLVLVPGRRAEVLALRFEDGFA